MSDFHDHLIAEAERLGATGMRIEAVGFKRHPHLAGMLNGKPFRYPLPGTFRDTLRRRRNYIMKVRHFLLERGAKLPSKELEEVTRMILRRANQAERRRERMRFVSTTSVVRKMPPTYTRLDRDPWAPLGMLLKAMEASP